MMFVLKNLFLYCKVWFRQTKYRVMMTKKGFSKILNFITTGAGTFVLGNGPVSHLVKMFFFLKILFNTRYRSDKVRLVMITKDGSSKIENFVTPAAGSFVPGHCPVSHIVKIHYFFKIA